MPEKCWFGIGISSGSQLPHSGIGILASGFSPVPLVTEKSGIAQLCYLCTYDLYYPVHNVFDAGRYMDPASRVAALDPVVKFSY